MAIHASLALCMVASLFVGGGVAFAQQTGTTSGPAAEKTVEPSTCDVCPLHPFKSSRRSVEGSTPRERATCALPSPATIMRWA
jgi:hypothetical protein